MDAIKKIKAVIENRAPNRSFEDFAFMLEMDASALDTLLSHEKDESELPEGFLATASAFLAAEYHEGLSIEEDDLRDRLKIAS